MSREVDDFFDEIETKIPDDVSRLVEKQMDIADAIVLAIEKSEYKTRKEFAQAIGMKPSMLSRILAGNVNLTLKTITKIELALGIDIINVNTQLSVQEKQYNISPELITAFSSFLARERMSLINGNKQYSENYCPSSEFVISGGIEGVYGNA